MFCAFVICFFRYKYYKNFFMKGEIVMDNLTDNKSKKLYVISNDYVNALKDTDYRVQNNYEGNRLYYKSEIKVDGDSDINYYVPLSSAKESQKKINNKSVFKLYGSESSQEDFLGVLHINNMIPVPNNKAELWQPNKNDLDKRYSMLVVKQSKFITKNSEKIEDQTKLLYDCKKNKVDPKFFKENRGEVMLYKKIMSDLNALEKVSIEQKDTNKITNYRRNEIDID